MSDSFVLVANFMRTQPDLSKAILAILLYMAGETVLGMHRISQKLALTKSHIDVREKKIRRK